MPLQKKLLSAIFAAVLTVFLLTGTAFALDPAENSESMHSVSVATVDEFLAAIAPDTEIRMAPGTYDLTQAQTYGRDSANYRWNSYGFPGEYELSISSIDHLTISGNGAEVLTVPRSSNVISFDSCNGITVTGLTAGHTEAADACEGGVLAFYGCDDIRISGCRLYGCGTTGVITYGCNCLDVSDTEIYHCSTSGFMLSGTSATIIKNCRIYDCGRPELYGEAIAAFVLYDSAQISIRGCEIYDNFSATMLQTVGSENVYFKENNIHDNQFRSMFECTGNTVFENLTVTGNVVDQWIGTNLYSDSFIRMDGKILFDSDLNLLWADQLSSAAIALIEPELKAIDRTGAREVHVSTADEFLQAIASDTVIVLDVPQIALKDASDYGQGIREDVWEPEFNGKNYAWVYAYDGSQLCIGNVNNFHIVGGEILAEPRYAEVLSYYQCSEVSLENVRLGHTPEQGICTGGVLYLTGCENIILENCDFYGCGTLGITAENTKLLHVQNTLIHDCSYGAAQLTNTDGAIFLGCSVANCPEPHFRLNACTNFSWDGKVMNPFANFNVE